MRTRGGASARCAPTVIAVDCVAIAGPDLMSRTLASDDVVQIHTRLLGSRGAQTLAVLHARMGANLAENHRSVTDAAFLVKTLLERRQVTAGRAVFRKLRGQVRMSSFPLQMSYATGLIAFENGVPAAAKLDAFRPGVERALGASCAEDLAFAIAILWRVSLLELSLGRSVESRRHLSQAEGLANELGDPTMKGVVATARGWYHIAYKDWQLARRAFLGGLLLLEYEGRPQRLWADLALGLAMVEIQAPMRYRMKVIDVLHLLESCADSVGKLRPYPMYSHGGGCLDPMMVASKLLIQDHKYQMGSRHIPASIREDLEKQRDAGCRRCGRKTLLVIDHLWFFSWGGIAGSPKRLNVRWLCRGCNATRSDRFNLDKDAFQHLARL